MYSLSSADRIVTPANLNPSPDRFVVVTKRMGETTSFKSPYFEQGVTKIEGKYKVRDVPEEVVELCRDLRNFGWHGLLIGGCVRDAVLNLEYPDLCLQSKDFDLEVYGADPKQLKYLLETKYGQNKVRLVGQEFNVYKVHIKGFPEPIDISIPREDNQTGARHKDVETTGRPDMPISEAGLRRDLKMNTLAYDPLTEILYDPYGGVENIQKRLIEVTDPEAFQEDPLRVLRIMQFAARFEMKVGESTKQLCYEMVENGQLDHLSGERVSEEFRKLLEKGRRPSLGLEFAREIGYIERYWPELHALTEFSDDKKALVEADLEATGMAVFDEFGWIDWKKTGVVQEYGFHPEGNLWEHTLQCVDAAAQIYDRVLAAKEYPDKLEAHYLKERINQEILSKTEMLRTVSQQEMIKELCNDGEDRISAINNRSEVIALGEKKKRVAQLTDNYREKNDLLFEQPIPESNQHEFENVGSSLFLVVEKRQKAILTDQLFKELLDLGKLPVDVSSRLEQRIEAVSEEFRKKCYQEEYAQLIKDGRVLLTLGALCHDFGKPAVTKYEDGAWRSRGHEPAGVEPAAAFLEHFYSTRFSSRLKKQVLPLVAYHLSPPDYLSRVEKGQISQDNAIRRMADKLNREGRVSLLMLSWVAEADQRGRNPDGIRENHVPLSVEECSANKDQKYECLDVWQPWLHSKIVILDVYRQDRQPMIDGNDLKEVLGLPRGGPPIGAILACTRLDELEGVVASPEQSMEKARAYYRRFLGLLTLDQRDDVEDFWTKIKWWPDPRIYPERLPESPVS